MSAETSNRDIFEAMNEMHRRMWADMRRSQLARSSQTPLNAPVYVEIEREMIHDSYRMEPLEDFIARIREKAAQAPTGCPVFVAYEEEGDYEGGSYTFFRIGYERPPTDEEKAARKAENTEIKKVKAEIAAENAERERKEFERLKAKFDSPD